MSMSGRRMAYVEYKQPKRAVVPKSERQRQKESLKVYRIAGEANDRTGSNRTGSNRATKQL
ncbi:hypothetical protein J40TS1_34240 [Paenibacillus montaniterrae]|uniref:Uncharacterized protein n=1 Tax=Paenibacillus montaniterrae TaxID=429341 RepID=A0A920CV66_9BACL|nr:hypothetical protein J40TS1_34240 [Paenibacillus montaniterrae]